MDEWDEIDLLGPAHITFIGKDGGELAFIAIEADLDVRYGSRDGAACAEFSWEGFDDGSPASGRGWAALAPPAAWSATSSSTKATIQASSPNASDFFNSLLELSITVLNQTIQCGHCVASTLSASLPSFPRFILCNAAAKLRQHSVFGLLGLFIGPTLTAILFIPLQASRTPPLVSQSQSSSKSAMWRSEILDIDQCFRSQWH